MSGLIALLLFMLILRLRVSCPFSIIFALFLCKIHTCIQYILKTLKPYSFPNCFHIHPHPPLTAANSWFSYTHGNGAILRNIVGLQLTCSSKAALICQHILSQWWGCMNPSTLHAKVLTGLILCSSCVGSDRCYGFLVSEGFSGLANTVLVCSQKLSSC